MMAHMGARCFSCCRNACLGHHRRTDSCTGRLSWTSRALAAVLSNLNHMQIAAAAQAGGDNKALDVKVPAGITRLFKSNLDWNLYTDQQKPLDERKVRTGTQLMHCRGSS